MIYVYSSTVVYPNRSVFVIITLLMSVFKIAWNVLVLIHMTTDFLHSRKLRAIRLMEEYGLATNESMVESFNNFIMRLLIGLSIFNNVLAPYISSIFINPNCFYYTIYSLPPIVAKYSFYYCTQWNVISKSVDCNEYEIAYHTTSYSPPFTYNFQCSSALLVSFSDIYLYRYLLTGLVMPLGILLLKYIHTRLDRKRKGNASSLARNQNVQKFFVLLYHFSDSILPLAFKLSEDTGGMGLYHISDTGIVEGRQTEIEMTKATTRSILHRGDNISSFEPNKENSNQNDEPISSSTEGSSPKHESPTSWNKFTFSATYLRLIFNKESYIIRFVGDLAVLLTFGLVYPPLAILVVLSICTYSTLIQLMLGRLLGMIGRMRVMLSEDEDVGQGSSRGDSNLKSQREECLLTWNILRAHLIREIADIPAYCKLAIPYLSVLLMIFISFSLFDTLGDSKGASAAIWIFLVLPGLVVMEEIIGERWLV